MTYEVTEWDSGDKPVTIEATTPGEAAEMFVENHIDVENVDRFDVDVDGVQYVVSVEWRPCFSAWKVR